MLPPQKTTKAQTQKLTFFQAHIHQNTLANNKFPLL